MCWNCFRTYKHVQLYTYTISCGLWPNKIDIRRYKYLIYCPTLRRICTKLCYISWHPLGILINDQKPSYLTSLVCHFVVLVICTDRLWPQLLTLRRSKQLSPYQSLLGKLLYFHIDRPDILQIQCSVKTDMFFIMLGNPTLEIIQVCTQISQRHHQLWDDIQEFG